MNEVLEDLPSQMGNLKSVEKAIPTSFLAASDIFNLIGQFLPLPSRE